MEVSGQLHSMAALSPGKEPSALIRQEVGWATESVWTRWWSKIPAPCRDTNPGRPARSLVTMLTDLSRLSLNAFFTTLRTLLDLKFIYCRYKSTVAKLTALPIPRCIRDKHARCDYEVPGMVLLQHTRTLTAYW